MNVMRHYNIKASQKAIDWATLLGSMTLIYGGKFHAISERQAKERKDKRDAAVAAAAPFGISG